MNRPYDVAPDGRFLIIRSGQFEAAGDTSSDMILAQNWFEELKRLVPTNEHSREPSAVAHSKYYACLVPASIYRPGFLVVLVG